VHGARCERPHPLGEAVAWLELSQRAWERRLPIEVDLGEAEHMHAAAWQVLFALQRSCEEHALKFQVRAMSSVAEAGYLLLGLDSELATAEAP
jgi:hypothetical protein